MVKKLFFALFWGFWGLNGALSPQEMEQIGRKIWQNEASGKEDLLVFWSKNEPFPSIGIGHNVWLPRGKATGYNISIEHQKFPLLCEYLKSRGVVLPAWIEQALASGAPWDSRKAFYNDTGRLAKLRQLMASTIGLQVEFLVKALHDNIELMLLAAPAKDRSKIGRNLDLLLSTSLGTYALIDYLNFKGAGLNWSQAPQGRRCGLLSVLIDMPDGLNRENVNKAFAACAAQKLAERVKHCGPDYKELVFLSGWIKRVSSYIK